MTSRAPRTEHDLIGNREIPGDAYYGIHTVRAVENFPISGSPIAAYPDLINALASVKQAAASANRDLGLLDQQRFGAIAAACADLREGQLHDQFVVDVVQGGAGTSTNMNANEVIANRALEHLGRPPGDYEHLHPLEHVNLSQSTNCSLPRIFRAHLEITGGPMQFLPATFAAYDEPIPPGGSNPPSPYNPANAIYAAAWYLCDSGARDGRDTYSDFRV